MKQSTINYFTSVICPLLNTLFYAVLAFLAIFYIITGNDTKATMFICLCILDKVCKL